MNCPPSRPVDIRNIACVICESPLAFYSTTSPHPKAPEMLSPIAERPWVGIVAGDGGAPLLVVVCGRACLERLLAE
jgi:hypothetical protein